MTGPLALAVAAIGAMRLDMADLGAPLPTEVEVYDWTNGRPLNLHAEPLDYRSPWHGGCILWSTIERLVPVRASVSS
jgi:hypothetical protein